MKSQTLQKDEWRSKLSVVAFRISKCPLSHSGLQNVRCHTSLSRFIPKDAPNPPLRPFFSQISRSHCVQCIWWNDRLAQLSELAGFQNVRCHTPDFKTSVVTLRCRVSYLKTLQIPPWGPFFRKFPVHTAYSAFGEVIGWRNSVS